MFIILNFVHPITIWLFWLSVSVCPSVGEIKRLFPQKRTSLFPKPVWRTMDEGRDNGFCSVFMAYLWGAGTWTDAIKGKELTLSEESFSDQGNHSKANKTMISSMWEPVYCEAVLGRTGPRRPPGPTPLPPPQGTQNRRKSGTDEGIF